MTKKIFILLVSLLIFFILCLSLFRFQFITTVIIKFSEKYYETQEFGNILFYYNESEQETIDRLLVKMPEIIDLGNRWFGGSTETGLTIYLPDSESVLNKLIGQANAMFFQNKNIAIFKNQLTESEMLHALAHEYGHYHLMNNMKGWQMEIDDIPEWFHEGVAEAFAHRFAPLPFNDVIEQWNVVPFSEMKMKGIRDPSIGERYTMSQFTIERLIYNFGEDIILRLLHSTKEKGFSDSFLYLTKEELNNYHKTLITKDDFINYVASEFGNEENWDELEQQLLQFDYINGPYYYQAEKVYDFLQLIYHERQEWEKALNMLLKKTEYIQSISIWNAASEYAIKIGDEERAKYYEKRAEELAEQGGGYFDKLLDLNK